jgi:glycine/D-amino acid oxidase-like deaminating enzyme
MAGTDREGLAVIGAGIVGICCGLYLQRAGFAVEIFDPDEPASHCSYGAAGNFGGNAHFAMRDIVWQIPKMLLDPTHPFEMRVRDAPMLLPWLRHYLRSAKPEPQAAIAAAAASLSRDG